MPTLPGSYTTVALVYEAIPMLKAVTDVTSADVYRAIGQTEGHMNGHLRKLYSLPFAADIPYLTRMSTDGSAYRLLRAQFTQEQQNKSEWVTQFRDDYREALEDLVEGNVELMDSSGNEIARAGAADVWSNTQDYEPTFTELHPREAVIDPDKIDDLRSERET